MGSEDILFLRALAGACVEEVEELGGCRRAPVDFRQGQRSAGAESAKDWSLKEKQGVARRALSFRQTGDVK